MCLKNLPFFSLPSQIKHTRVKSQSIHFTHTAHILAIANTLGHVFTSLLLVSWPYQLAYLLKRQFLNLVSLAHLNTQNILHRRPVTQNSHSQTAFHLSRFQTSTLQLYTQTKDLLSERRLCHLWHTQFSAKSYM